MDPDRYMIDPGPGEMMIWSDTGEPVDTVNDDIKPGDRYLDTLTMVWRNFPDELIHAG